MGSCSDDDVNTIVEDFRARIIESNLNRCKKVLISEYIKRIVEVIEAEEYL